MPITLPAASISGPPELPGLIAASVWITLEIEKPLGAWIWRWRAETMPAGHGAVEAERVADRDHRIADLDLRGVAERKRVQLVCRHVDLEHGDVGRRVGADDLARRELVSSEPSVTCDLGRPVDDVALVRMWPSVSIRKPEPVATPPPSPPVRVAERVIPDDPSGLLDAWMKATPCPSRR